MTDEMQWGQNQWGKPQITKKSLTYKRDVEHYLGKVHNEGTSKKH